MLTLYSKTSGSKIEGVKTKAPHLDGAFIVLQLNALTLVCGEPSISYPSVTCQCGKAFNCHNWRCQGDNSHYCHASGRCNPGRYMTKPLSSTVDRG